MKYCQKEDDVFYHTVMTKTKTKCTEDPTYAIFSNSREFKDTDAEITKTNTKTYTKTKTETKTRTKTKCIKDPTYAIFLKSREPLDIKYDQTRPDQVRPGQTRTEKRRIQSCRPNSRTCVLVYVGLPSPKERSSFVLDVCRP